MVNEVSALAHQLLKESWRADWESIHRWTGWRCCFLYKESADTYGAEMRWCHKNNDSDNFKAIASSSRLRRRPICMLWVRNRERHSNFIHSRLPQSSPLFFVARSLMVQRRAPHMMPFGRVSLFFYLHARTHSAASLAVFRAARWKMRGPRAMWKVVAPLSCAVSFAFCFMACLWHRDSTQLDLRTV